MIRVRTVFLDSLVPPQAEGIIMSFEDSELPEEWIFDTDYRPASKSERKRLKAEINEEFTRYIQRETVGSAYTTFAVFTVRCLIVVKIVVD